MSVQDFFLAVIDDNLKSVKHCLKEGVDPNARDEGGFTPLHWACRSGKTAIVKLLLTAGADPNARWTDNITSLDWACTWGYIAIVRLLLTAGADVNTRNSDGNTPLHWACWNGHAGIARFLLERGADPGAQDTHGETPLDKILQLSIQDDSLPGREELIELFRKYAPELYFSAFCTQTPSMP